ncbi:Phosphoacetylglucosamine mutase [Rhizoclosmatium globosum]|uniref:Phosphoacetylglucosamine mutase n=1 Tax=Rhizoclosmatium globosum TaxID=329046 RepID=A0A1Y2C3I9_9FUNG|nr:Phosphoacetylglucosamine mutase [Rhizoclosmatium globosum]|eukprot:ORY41588.1 Phosphoacetylglucosamine mutase [Rhizoclosmatium globosum]
MTNSFDKAKLANALSSHTLKSATRFQYGTAGFRMEASLLDPVMFAVGLLAVLRSKYHKGKTIGVMVTASHNPEKDNGVKLVEPLGEMLVQSWEGYATELANATSSADAITSALESIIAKEKIDLSQPARVVVARDTRPSGKALVASLVDGVQCLGGEIKDFGLFTTPQLHYVVRCINTAGTEDAYGEPTEEAYYEKLAAAFKKITAGYPRLSPLLIDGANGIGAPAMEKLGKYLGDSFAYQLVNNDVVSSGKLNHESGADFVKIKQTKPLGMDLKYGQRACSLDGDADRIVFYFTEEDGTFRLLDGDKIATLAADFIMDLAKQANILVQREDGSKTPLHIGLVQTAYANGSSTAYVKDTLQVPVVFTPTGVKHLHHAAEEFDVGVYFEANGHGTVLFSPAAIKAFKTSVGATPAAEKAIDALRALTELINQAVGDALSDMLLVEATLTYQQKSFAKWNSDYTDLPSRQEKVKVANRANFVPIKADTELSHPIGLQEKINEQVAKFSKGRCFVRPSGTEDIVRVYAEAATREETDRLCYLVCGLVFDGYGGVGTRPTTFLP